MWRSGNRQSAAFVMALTLTVFGLIGSFVFYRYSTQYLMQGAARASTEAANGDVVKLVSNVIKAETQELIGAYTANPELDWEAFAQSPEFVAFDTQARAMALDTQILKIKVYARDGMTVYSTDVDQLGDDYSETEEVIHALRGRSSSEISERDSFKAFTRSMADATIVSSYHSLANETGRIVGVVEVYANRTREFNQLNRELLTFAGYKLMILVSMLLASMAPIAYVTFTAVPNAHHEK